MSVHIRTSGITLYYLLKGVVSDSGQETWLILKTFRNKTPDFRKTFVDRISENEDIMYRIMVVDKIRTLNIRQSVA